MTEQTPDTTSLPQDESSSNGRSTRRIVLVAVAVAVLIALAGGAFAVYKKLDGGGAQPHDVLPASTQIYARLDVDPSASQKVELLKLIRKFPEAAKSAGITSPDQDVRKLIFDELVADGCPDVDYETDVKPWLGERIGVGGEIKDEEFVVAVQVKDEEESRAGLKTLFACADEDYGIAFLDGYALLSDDQSVVDEAVKGAEKASLGDRKEFASDFDDLGEQGVASAWFDVKSIIADPEVKKALGAQADELDTASSVATTLRVKGSTLELAALGGLGRTADTKAVPLGTLPADTVAALSVAGVGPQIGAQYDSFLEEFTSAFAEGFAPDDPASSPDPQDFIDEIEQATGFKLPDDLETLFGDSLTLTVGGKNLETVPTLAGPADISALDVALSLTSERSKALALVQRIADLAEQTGIPLVAAGTDDGAVLATNQGAADAIVGGDGTLGKQKSFTDVMPGGESNGGLYVDVRAILDKINESDPPADLARDIEEAKAISAVGFSVSTQEKDRSLVSFRMSFAK